MIERFGARAIVLAIFAAFLIGLVLFGVSQCRERQSAETQTRVTTGQVGAATGSGAAAVNSVGGVMANDASTDATVAAGQKDITAAPEGEKGAATVAAACRLRAYRETPACKEPSK